MQGIERDLARWGAWAREQLPGKIKALLLYREGEAQRQKWVEPMTDEEGKAFDPAVAALREADGDLYEIVRMRYIYGLSFYAIAKAQSKHTKDIVTKGRKAEAFVTGFMQGAVFRDALDKKRSGLVAP